MEFTGKQFKEVVVNMDIWYLLGYGFVGILSSMLTYIACRPAHTGTLLLTQDEDGCYASLESKETMERTSRRKWIMLDVKKINL